MTTDDRNLRAGALLLIAVGCGALALLGAAIVLAVLGLDAPAFDAPPFGPHVASLAASLVIAMAGLGWLVLLRSADESWEHAVREHQIQGFNGVILLAVGLQLAVNTAAEIVDATGQWEQATTVLGFVALWIPLGAFLGKVRPLTGDSPRRR